MYKKLLQGVVLLGICTLSTICAAAEGPAEQKVKPSSVKTGATDRGSLVRRKETATAIVYTLKEPSAGGENVEKAVYRKQANTYHHSLFVYPGKYYTTEPSGAYDTFLAMKSLYESQQKARQAESTH